MRLLRANFFDQSVERDAIPGTPDPQVAGTKDISETAVTSFRVDLQRLVRGAAGMITTPDDIRMRRPASDSIMRSGPTPARPATIARIAAGAISRAPGVGAEQWPKRVGIGMIGMGMRNEDGIDSADRRRLDRRRHHPLVRRGGSRSCLAVYPGLRR